MAKHLSNLNRRNRQWLRKNERRIETLGAEQLNYMSYIASLDGPICEDTGLHPHRAIVWFAFNEGSIPLMPCMECDGKLPSFSKKDFEYWYDHDEELILETFNTESIVNKIKEEMVFN